MFFSFPKFSPFIFAHWFWAGLPVGIALSVLLLGRDMDLVLAWRSAVAEHPLLEQWGSVTSRSLFKGGRLGAQDVSHLVLGLVLAGYGLSIHGRLRERLSVLRVWSGYWLACMLCFFAVNRGMKVFFARVRPSDALRGEIDGVLAGGVSQYEFIDALSKGSFTSGHTTMAMVLLPLAFLALRRTRKYAVVLFILALAWGLFVGWGRVISGSHYPTDILWAVIVCVWICAYVQERLVRPHVLPDARERALLGDLILAAWFALGLFLVFLTATGIKEAVFRFVWWWPPASVASGLAAWFCLRRAAAIRRSHELGGR